MRKKNKDQLHLDFESKPAKSTAGTNSDRNSAEIHTFPSKQTQNRDDRNLISAILRMVDHYK